jgi:putative transposase
MKTIRVYRLSELSPSLFRRLKAAQQEAAQVWNFCMETHKRARMTHASWPGRSDLQRATKGRYGLHSQSVQMVVHAFLANIQTTRRLKDHPEMRMKYPWREKRFYPVHWPVQAVHREKGRVLLPMGKGRPSLGLPLDLPDNAGACTLCWNCGFELHVCMEVRQRDAAPGGVQATVDLGEIHLAAVTTTTSKAMIVTGRGIRSLKRQRTKQLGQIAKKQSRCTKHSRRWKRLQRAKNKVCHTPSGACAICAIRRLAKSLTFALNRRWDALHRQPAIAAGITTSACLCGNTDVTSTISPINPSKPAS